MPHQNSSHGHILHGLAVLYAKMVRSEKQQQQQQQQRQNSKPFLVYSFDKFSSLLILS